uniref:Uncharacterized protein n=1 Tax=viral metagenome TaxID=1070528 RepID=A0A2V0RM55_9ZZZZ
MFVDVSDVYRAAYDEDPSRADKAQELKLEAIETGDWDRVNAFNLNLFHEGLHEDNDRYMNDLLMGKILLLHSPPHLMAGWTDDWKDRETLPHKIKWDTFIATLPNGKDISQIVERLKRREADPETGKFDPKAIEIATHNLFNHAMLLREYSQGVDDDAPVKGIVDLNPLLGLYKFEQYGQTMTEAQKGELKFYILGGDSRVSYSVKDWLANEKAQQKLAGEENDG